MIKHNIKNLFSTAIIFFIFIFILSPKIALAAEPPDINAAAYVLMSSDTGEVLAKNNADVKRFPASTTKLMTMTLIMEAIKNGEIDLNDQITTSEYAASMGGSQVYLEAGETRTLEEMLIGIAVGSGNDASVAVAEYMCGTESAFVEKMNQKAQELGMKNTNYVNPHGLHDENHYTTAEDMANLAYYALKYYPEILNYTSIYEYQFRPDPNPLVLWNTNKLLKWYEGVDGLKTGYTSYAGKNLVATATRNNMRLITVVMGAEEKNGHFKETSKLLDFGFNNYVYNKVYDKGTVICSVPVQKGSSEYIDLITGNISGFLTEKSTNSNYETNIKINPNIKAPIATGDVLGQLEITVDNKIISSTDLKAITNVPKISLWQCIYQTVDNIFSLS